MDIPETLKIMRALANGKNPETGDPLENGSICRHRQTIKALNRAISALVHEQNPRTQKADQRFRFVDPGGRCSGLPRSPQWNGPS
jgi:hypothetical protein